MRTEAYLSEDRAFRYWLLRYWNEALPLLAVIGCNPSTADEKENDHTIKKTVGFAERLNLGGVLMLNVGAFRATYPRDWKASRDPFGPENTIDHLQGYLVKFAPAMVVAAWGKPCMISERGRHRADAIKKNIVEMKCWGRNEDGSPRHPLRLSYSTQLQPFNF